MKSGRTLTEVAQELERQLQSKKDYVADSRRLMLRPTGKVDVEGIGEFGVTHHAHAQIAGRLKIPKQYYDRMRTEAPALLAQNVNTWFQRHPEKRMVRTLDGDVRAFLSHRYRPLDNFDLANVVLPQFADMDMQVQSCEVTESHLYLKVVTEAITATVVGDIVQAGLVVSNSEIGCGSLRVEPMLYRLACLNGMISADHSMKKYHTGRSAWGDADENGGAAEFFTDDTRRADDKAFWMKVRDTVRGALNETTFRKMVKSVEVAAGREIDSDPVKVVERVAERYQLPEAEQGGILKHLTKGGDLSQWGLVNAITRYSQDVEGYERATDLERLGGDVIALPAADWERLNVA